MKIHHCVVVSLLLLLLDSLSSLPATVFWDNNDWPSDLTSAGDSNNDDEVGKELDFFPLENPYLISEQSNLDLIGNDPDKAQVLTDIFNNMDDNKDGVEVKTGNGSWINELYLPDASEVPNLSQFQLSCDSSWSVKVHYNNGDTTRSVSNGNYVILAVLDGVWITEEQYNPTPNPTATPTKADENTNPPLLEGTVMFAQSQIIPSKHGISGDSQPHLTSLRKTLVMFRAQDYNNGDSSSVELTVRDGEGTILSGSEPIVMNNPEDIPKQDGWIELGDAVPNIPPSLTNPYVIKDQSNLNQIGNDSDAAALTAILNTPNQNEVEIKTKNGSWVKDIYLPIGSTIPTDSKIQVTCNSEYKVNVYYPNTQTGGWRKSSLSNGMVLVWALVNGSTWVTQDDLTHNEYVFGHGFYTATLSEDWVLPGMTLKFARTQYNGGQENKVVGILEDIDIGGVTELVITALDAGFLTEPRNQFTFRDDLTTHREYFETTPASRLVVVQYESMHLKEVMLPTGKLYYNVSDTDGGWHTGDMRQYIGKLLLSHGIDLANYGISSSWAQSESPHPFTCALLAAHNTVGMYQNGRQVHGGSGGNGMITLDSSTGNEMSHEVGHNYGLGHYVDGFDGSVHRSSNEINSSWGWNSEYNVFIPNFAASDSGKDRCLDEKCQSPFLGKYQYGTDSMAGGSPMWGSNRFTLYTPNSSRKIQEFLERKAVWDPTSSTGFRKYDSNTNQMEEFTNAANGNNIPRLYRVPVTTIVGYYDPKESRSLQSYIFPAMHGAYGFVYNDDGGAGDGSSYGCELVIKTRNGGNLVFELSTGIDSKGMNKFHVNVATEDQPYEAQVYCQNTLRADRALDGPRDDESLIFTVTGVPFEGGDDTPTAVPTSSPTNAESTSSPTMAPTIAETSSSPTMAPTNEEITSSPTMAPTNAESTSSPTIAPTNAETTSSPTMAPTIAETTSSPTMAPTNAESTSSPTMAPTKVPLDCKDDLDFKYKDKKKKNCEWVGRKRVKKRCKKRYKKIRVYNWCPTTCGKVKLGKCKS